MSLRSSICVGGDRQLCNLSCLIWFVVCDIREQKRALLSFDIWRGTDAFHNWNWTVLNIYRQFEENIKRTDAFMLVLLFSRKRIERSHWTDRPSTRAQWIFEKEWKLKTGKVSLPNTTNWNNFFKNKGKAGLTVTKSVIIFVYGVNIILIPSMRCIHLSVFRGMAIGSVRGLSSTDAWSDNGFLRTSVQYFKILSCVPERETGVQVKGWCSLTLYFKGSAFMCIILP